MQHIGKILEMNPQKISSGAEKLKTTNNPKPTSSHSNDTNNISKRIDLLFSKFAAFYGHIWRSQFKDEGFLKFAKKEWQEGLQEFTDAILTNVILNCRAFYELPPTLPQIINDCRQIKKRTSFYVVNNNHVPVAREVVESHLKQCKELLTKPVRRS